MHYGKNLRILDKGLGTNPGRSRPVPLNRRHLNIPPKPYPFTFLRAALVIMAVMCVVSVLMFFVLSSRVKSTENYPIGASGQFSTEDCAQLSKMAGRKVC